ncbi:MAG: VOC family protein [Dehalococcoidia bacterium]
MTIKFNDLMPELYVSNYRRSLSFYIDVLGFKLEYDRTDPAFSFLSYGNAQLMIQQKEPTDWHTGALEYPYGRGINFEIRTTDIDVLLERLSENNYPVRRGIKESWRKAGGMLVGSKEIHVLDPDGYFLRFSQAIGRKPLSGA